MKNTINRSQTTISQHELANLTNIVKETLAVEQATRVKSFTTADLWNIHRMGKLRSCRRYM